VYRFSVFIKEPANTTHAGDGDMGLKWWSDGNITDAWYSLNNGSNNSLFKPESVDVDQEDAHACQGEFDEPYRPCSNAFDGN
ncbi:MAG: hypothetical protein DRO99_02965, partial [Candidatus Aenigmatarchaeota archaeon]